MSAKKTLSVRLFGEKTRIIEVNSHDVSTVEDAIQVCLKEGLAALNIPTEAIFLFGLQTQNTNWLRPGLLLANIPELCATEDSGFANIENVELRIRYIFPPTEVMGRSRFPIRYGGDRLYDKGVAKYLFYQARHDLLNGKIALKEDGGQLSNAMGIAILDMLRIKSQRKQNDHRSFQSPKFKELLPPNALQDIKSLNQLNKYRIRKRFRSELRKIEERDDIRVANEEYFRKQYLFNVWENLKREHWGEIYYGKYVQSQDAGQIWIHPELGLQYKRKGEIWRGFKEGFAGILATRRTGAVLQIQFTSHNHIEIALASAAKAVDLHIYLEGMTNLLVNPHHYMSEFVSWPMICEQADLNGFGPITRKDAELVLKPGYSLLRRSPHTHSPKEWYLTCANDQNEIQNYRIALMQGGMYVFSGRGSACDQFASINELVDNCTNNNQFPFDITKRITPFCVWGTRLQIIRSSIAPMLKYHQSPWRSSSKTALDTAIDLPNHSVYAENKIQFEVNLGGGNFTEVQAGRIKNSDQTQRGIQQSVVVKRLRPMERFMRQVNGMDSVDKASIRISFHQSLTLIHRSTHPHIVRLMGTIMVGPTGSIILEKASGGSLSEYLRRKCNEINTEDQYEDDKTDFVLDDSMLQSFENVDINGLTSASSLLLSPSYSGRNSSSAPIQTGETMATMSTTIDPDLSPNNSGQTVTTSENTSAATIGGKSDKKFLKRNWMAWKLEVFWQIATALRHLSDKSLTHGNLKASNCLLFTDGPTSAPQPMIKLADPGVTTTLSNEGNVQMQLPPPWRPIEYLFGNKDELKCTVDNWAFATTIAEISQWCLTSKQRLGYPEDDRHLSREEKEKYCNQNLCEMASWMNDLNPRLIPTLKKCWAVEPMSRTPYNVILRELETAKFNARANDSTLSMPIPTNPSVMDDHLNVNTFDDCLLTSVRPLGQGHFGVVELCSYDRDPFHSKGMGELVAVKSLRDNMRTKPIMDDFRNEFEMMREFDHKNIVKLRGLSLPSGRLVMEYIEKGSLFHWLGGKNKQGVAFAAIREQLVLFATQICEGMQYLHSKKSIHRDLAARNVMVAYDSLQPSFLIAKISDFGLSRQISNNKDYYRGNPEEFPVQWYAPECIKEQYFAFESDVWSYGVTLWEIFSYGKKPEYRNIESGKSLTTLIELFQALEGGQRLPRPETCPDPMFVIIMKCWEFLWEKRPTFNELYTLLQNYDVRV